jgi:hypothetical protein
VEVAFEEGAGVLAVWFGMGFGGGDAGERFVQNLHDPALVRERRQRKLETTKRFAGEMLNPRTVEVL